MIRFMERALVVGTFGAMGALSLVPRAPANARFASNLSRLSRDPGDEIRELRERLDILEDKLAAVELRASATATIPNKVKAPFAVTDAAGKLIFRVSEATRGFQVYDANEIAVAGGTAAPTGGFFKAINADESRTVVLGTLSDAVMLSLRDGKDGKSTRASIIVGKGGLPTFQIFNKSHVAVAALSHDDQGAIFQLDNEAGSPRVEMGVLKDDRGVVHLGPRFNCAAKGGLVVPDCIVGHR